MVEKSSFWYQKELSRFWILDFGFWIGSSDYRVI
jgi:hypothetical protein